MTPREALDIVYEVLCADYDPDNPSDEPLDYAEAIATLEALVSASEWKPIESAPVKQSYWLVWSGYYQRPVVITNRMENNTYWEGDWDFDVEATHHLPLTTPEVERKG